MRSLDGKVVAITGAGAGIGRALALDAARQQAVLALSDWDEAGLLETADLVASEGFGVPRTHQLDVRDRAAMHAYADSLRVDLGRVNAVVNNAGVALHGDFEEVSYEDFDWVMDVDFWGVVQGTKAFLPHLIESGDAHVVNVSSLFGLMAVPGQSAYNAAKFGVRGFTEALRQEMLVAGHPVGVTCVHPGGIRTAIVRNARTTASHVAADVAQHFDTKLARTSPERAAEVIWAAVRAGRPRAVVGADARVLDAFVRLLGPRYQDVVARLYARVGPDTQAAGAPL